jgi:hypothetical protein
MAGFECPVCGAALADRVAPVVTAEEQADEMAWLEAVAADRKAWLEVLSPGKVAA